MDHRQLRAVDFGICAQEHLAGEVGNKHYAIHLLVEFAVNDAVFAAFHQMAGHHYLEPLVFRQATCHRGGKRIFKIVNVYHGVSAFLHHTSQSHSTVEVGEPFQRKGGDGELLGTERRNHLRLVAAHNLYIVPRIALPACQVEHILLATAPNLVRNQVINVHFHDGKILVFGEKSAGR